MLTRSSRQALAPTATAEFNDPASQRGRAGPSSSVVAKTTVGGGGIPGALHCVCDVTTLRSLHELLIECTRCGRYLHPACCDVDTQPTMWRIVQSTFVCPYCDPSRFPAIFDAAGTASPNVSSRNYSAATTPQTMPLHDAPQSGRASSRSGSTPRSSPSPSSSATRSSATPSKVAVLPKTDSSSAAASLPSSPGHNASSSRKRLREAAPVVTPRRIVATPDRPLANASKGIALRAIVDFCRRRILSQAAAHHQQQVLRKPVVASPVLIEMATIPGTASSTSSSSLLTFPEHSLDDGLVDAAMRCCRSSIQDGTFSTSYPLQCLREQQLVHHPYLQGAMVVATERTCCPASSPSPMSNNNVSGSLEMEEGNDRRRVDSFVLSNGMDPYSNLKATIGVLKREASIASQLSEVVGRNNSTGVAADEEAAAARRIRSVQDQLREVGQTDDFVHIVLLSTAPEARGRQLATLLLLLDLSRWALRGRTRAVVNMALHKAEDGRGVDVQPASAAVYEKLGFVPVLLGPSSCISGDAATTCKSLASAFEDSKAATTTNVIQRAAVSRRPTATEVDSGKVLVNLNIVDTCIAVHQRMLLTTAISKGACP